MLTGTFTTHSIHRREQLDAWRSWFAPIFDAASATPPAEGFAASNSYWTLGGLTISRVLSPPTAVTRTKSLIRRSSADHWGITISEGSESEVTIRNGSLKVLPRVPYILSLGEEMSIRRTRADSRVQLLLSRDDFSECTQLLDSVRGITLDTPQGKLLADYILLLERNLANLTSVEAIPLKTAVHSMIEACLASSADRLARARDQIDATLMERVRRAVSRNLRSPSLGPERLCREAATSRSQLYRLLEKEGGAAHYIQRRRLSASFASLCDASNTLPIEKIAEMLCFADASSFSRAFRREFAVNPRDVRAASLSGLYPSAPTPPVGRDIRTFADCLRSF